MAETVQYMLADKSLSCSLSRVILYTMLSNSQGIGILARMINAIE